MPLVFAAFSHLLLLPMLVSVVVIYHPGLHPLLLPRDRSARGSGSFGFECRCKGVWLSSGGCSVQAKVATLDPVRFIYFDVWHVRLTR
eukprot:3050914-Pyramimonas_sp.AAC.1